MAIDLVSDIFRIQKRGDKPQDLVPIFYLPIQY